MATTTATRGITANIAYSGRGVERPRYYANAHERDVLDIVSFPMTVRSARGLNAGLDVEGFLLADAPTQVGDWADAAQIRDIYVAEVEALLRRLTGADAVKVSPHGILRFSEASGRAGSGNNSHPARFAHIDIADSSAFPMAERGAEGRTYARFANYNVWRAISAPPQDVPLALCDARSFAPEDLIVADAIFDEPDGREWGFEGLLVAHNPAHQWYYYPDMQADEAIVFKSKDSHPTAAHHIPHVAFNDPTAVNAIPRSSIEMRATCYWWA
ncbi:hypothetical protein GTZ99_08365 [Novosphingobium sp. FSY-8]|uniref:Methyltransferase n=1 Tax=Novosphingobium ovatum TaxID=1908523 RepID=A0ABW9XDE2_9SPHN|nr:CmcJ/NvfI family oxidoreductase [Novosphingobium ovatum]NBC36569.1 hypothetical protein [Novosphingobium ovatum]